MPRSRTPLNARALGGHLATSEVVSVDDHLSLGQLSATQISLENTRLSQLPSYRVDGLETQLMAESFNNNSQLLNQNNSQLINHNNSQLLCNSSNSMGANEEAIIELEEMIPKITPQKNQNFR